MKTIATVLAAAVLTLLLYGATIEYGLHYDDYYFVKPYTRAEVVATFSGSWDDSGIMVPFYRPLTILFYAARFELFGLNSAAHHAASLVMFALASVMAGLLARRMTGHAASGFAAALAFAAHPAMPYGQAAWITNQMHLLTSLVVLSGLLWWHAVAGRGVIWWLPLLAFGAAAFLVKEDGIMMIPAILILHWLRRTLHDPALPRAPRVFVVLAALLVITLIGLRHEMLGGLGGYGRPTLAGAWGNFTKGLRGVFLLLPADRPWQPLASAFAVITPLAALVCWRGLPTRTRLLIAAGGCLGLLFNLPFVFVSKVEQMHLVALGASLLLAGSAVAVVERAKAKVVRIAVLLATSAGFAACAAVARDITTDFAPYGPIVRSTDVIVQGWAAVPAELREYLERKGAGAASRTVSANPVEEIRLIGFGFHGVESTPEGMSYRWMARPRAELHVAADVRQVEFAIRHEAGAFREPARATISVDGRLADELNLPDGQWRTLRYLLPAGDVPRISRMHRIAVDIAHTWTPARVIPGSTDGRQLGLQIGAVAIR